MTIHQGLPVNGVGQRQSDGALLIYRLEGQLRGAAKPAIGSEGVCFVHDLEANIVEGPLSGHHLSGLHRLTLRADGVGLLACPETIECDSGSVSLDVRGFMVSPPDMGSPRPEAASAQAYEFPDRDYQVTGSARVQSADPSYAYLDGRTASIEGWVNFESGEVEVEAWAM